MLHQKNHLRSQRIHQDNSRNSYREHHKKTSRRHKDATENTCRMKIFCKSTKKISATTAKDTPGEKMEDMSKIPERQYSKVCVKGRRKIPGFLRKTE